MTSIFMQKFYGLKPEREEVMADQIHVHNGWNVHGSNWSELVFLQNICTGGAGDIDGMR